MADAAGAHQGRDAGVADLGTVTSLVTGLMAVLKRFRHICLNLSRLIIGGLLVAAPALFPANPAAVPLPLFREFLVTATSIARMARSAASSSSPSAAPISE